MVVVIDNYDSFTYNLVHDLGALGEKVHVYRNDALTLERLEALGPDRIVISPGPGRPEAAGISVDVIRSLGSRVPILGVCLGHQAVGVAFGGCVMRASRPIHGRASTIEHDGRGLFSGIPRPLVAGRYHSLVVADEGFPPELEIVARAREDGAIMALRHRAYPVYGVQFHPESILTPQGRRILRNFLEG